MDFRGEVLRSESGRGKKRFKLESEKGERFVRSQAGVGKKLGLEKALCFKTVKGSASLGRAE